MKSTLGAFIILLSVCSVLAQAPRPKDGYVPDEKTAVKIAEAVLSPNYGKQQIVSERPFIATLKNGVWTVGGSLPKGYDVGGVAVIKIDKQSGAILSYVHYK